MSFAATLHSLRSVLRVTLTISGNSRCYAKTILGALGGKTPGLLAGALDKKKRLPVETNPEKLVNYCCGSNFYKTGEDVKLKPDEEYPDWLWTLRLGPPPPLEEMDPNTKEYWEHLAFLQKIRKLRLRRIKQKPKLFVNEQDKVYKLRELRFRALAHQFDPGYDTPPTFDRPGNRIL